MTYSALVRNKDAPQGDAAPPQPGAPEQAFGNRWAIVAGLLVWMYSGNPIITGSPYYQGWLIAGFVVQVGLCFRPVPPPRRAVVLLVVTIMFVLWTLLATTAGISGQFTGLTGQLLKIGIVLLPMMYLRDPGRALVDAMALICLYSIPIYGIRQLGRAVGFDIADLFSTVYPLTNVSPDRTIFIFNFDVAEEIGRNSGPFREPGIYAANVVIAALLLMSNAVPMEKHAIRLRLALFALALLTTRSTMGFATVPFLGILALRFLVVDRAQRLLLVPLLLIGVAGAAYGLGLSQANKVDHQIETVQQHKNTWYNTRFGNAYIDYVAIKARPLLGYGFSEDGRPHVWAARENAGELGLGNGLTGTAVKFGVLFTGLLLALYLACFLTSLSTVALALCAWFVLIILLFSQQLLLLPAGFLLLGDFFTAAHTRRPSVRQSPAKSEAAT
ncbi:MAG: hypothetical protein EOO38_08245 [Cytophagaceae bacterium]|nr:MAG: hypothetical protein EOO38_08245 [Cytophagaceae bacterium]